MTEPAKTFHLSQPEIKMLTFWTAETIVRASSALGCEATDSLLPLSSGIPLPCGECRSTARYY
jgi:hypothetical protein